MKISSRVVSAFAAASLIGLPAAPSRAAEVVVASGSDGYRVVYSGGELSPYDFAAITGLGVLSETVTYLSGSTSVTTSFSGVSLWSFVEALGIATDASVKNDLLSKYLVVTASDGYKAAFSMGEFSSDFGGSLGDGTGAPDLIAFSENGRPLGSDGAFRIVVPSDVKGGRYVSNMRRHRGARRRGRARAGHGG